MHHSFCLFMARNVKLLCVFFWRRVTDIFRFLLAPSLLEGRGRSKIFGRSRGLFRGFRRFLLLGTYLQFTENWQIFFINIFLVLQKLLLVYFSQKRPIDKITFFLQFFSNVVCFQRKSKIIVELFENIIPEYEVGLVFELFWIKYVAK